MGGYMYHKSGVYKNVMKRYEVDEARASSNQSISLICMANLMKEG